MLLDLVKDHLKITWEDEDFQLINIIERAKASLNKGNKGVNHAYCYHWR